MIILITFVKFLRRVFFYPVKRLPIAERVTWYFRNNVR